MLDEVEYELRVRGLDLSSSTVEEKRKTLRKAQLEELHTPRILESQNTIYEESTIVQIKLVTIRQELELKGPKPELLSRLRYARLRVIRSKAIDDFQVKMKEELLEEIEIIFEVFASPEERVSRMRMSTTGRRTLQTSMENPSRHPAFEFPPPPHVPRSSEIGTNTNLSGSNTIGNEVGSQRRREELQSTSMTDAQFNQRTNQYPMRENRVQESVEAESPTTPPVGERAILRAEVSRMVENVLATQMENMMTKFIQSMHNMHGQNQPNNERDRTSIERQFQMEHPNTPNRASEHQYQRSRNSDNVQSNDRSRQYERGSENHRRPAATNEAQRNNNNDHIQGQVALNVGERGSNWKIPMNKWPIKFSGDPRGMSVEEFVRRVEILARNNQVSDEELLSKVNFLFRQESTAEIWYYTFSHKFTSWQVLKYHLRIRFEVPNKDKVVEKQIRERKQLPNETFIAYLGEIERLCQQMSEPMDEKIKLDILIDNMRDWYRPHMAFINTAELNVEALSKLCYDLDKSVYRSYVQRNKVYSVNCLDQEGQPEESNEGITKEISAVTKIDPRANQQAEDTRGKRNNTESNVLCWNCRQYGHFWKKCERNKRVFCHLCGRANVLVNNCPENHRNLYRRTSKNMYREGF